MNIKIDVPDGVCGNYKIDTFEVSKEEAKWHNLRASLGRCRPILPGVYKRLKRGGTTVMSNTPMEIQDHINFIERAHGRVLINGLGLGMALKAILEREDLVSATVVEISPEVIELVAPTYESDPRVEIINADAFKYRPPRGRHYQAVWHDIWDDICGDNVSEMDKLHRKYRSKSDWQGSWCRRECLRQNRSSAW